MRSALVARVFSRAQQRLGADAYRFASGCAFCASAVVCAVQARANTHDSSRFAEKQSFLNRAQLVANAKSTENHCVQLFCVWTEDEPNHERPSRGHHTSMRMKVVSDQDDIFVSSLILRTQKTVPETSEFVSNVSDPPYLAEALRSARSVKVDRDGRDGIRVRFEGADAIRCTRSPTSSEQRAGLIGDSVAGLAVSLLVARIAGLSFRARISKLHPRRLLTTRMTAAVLCGAQGAAATIRSAVVAALAAPAAWRWRHWTQIFDKHERTYGDGSPRWPVPSKSTLSLVTDHIVLFLIQSVAFGAFGGLLVATLAVPFGATCGLCFWLARVRFFGAALTRYSGVKPKAPF